MGLNLFQAFQNFMSGAQQQYGPGFDPSTVCKNMLGNNCATPQQALQKLLQDGKISQAQYDQFSRML